MTSHLLALAASLALLAGCASGGIAVLPVAEEFRDFDKLRIGDDSGSPQH